MYLSFVVIIIALLAYYSIGRNLILEKKIFTIQFSYIFFYFAIAPLLHFYTEYYAADLFFRNFELALFNLNLINIFGIIFLILGFCFANGLKLKNNSKASIRINWKILCNLSFTYFMFSLCYFIYLSMTTTLFYVEAKNELEGSNLFQYMILESTPIIFTWGILGYLKLKNKTNFLFYFILFLIVTILFAGLRGSRVTIIFNVVNFLLLYSFLIKPLNWKKFIPLLIIGFVFNTVYSNYKYSGIEGLKNYLSTGEKASYIATKENSTLLFLLGDLARSDVQSKIIENIEYGQYKPSYMPETYTKAITLILPDKLDIENFESKRILGTEALYGFKGDNYYSSSRIYGLLGEGLINFSFYSIPFIFFLYGVIHLLCLNVISVIRTNQYILFLPLVFFMPIYLIFYDLDNIIFQILKNWTAPFLVFIIYSVKKNEN
ncbi:oligosaccharide repeat unit polymerase [Acinetobacter indicus]|nr:oligosaccharide repeat unit polymerase [Acinetobacter indicus]